MGGARKDKLAEPALPLHSYLAAAIYRQMQSKMECLRGTGRSIMKVGALTRLLILPMLSRTASKAGPRLLRVDALRR